MHREIQNKDFNVFCCILKVNWTLKMFEFVYYSKYESERQQQTDIDQTHVVVLPLAWKQDATLGSDLRQNAQFSR